MTPALRILLVMLVSIALHVILGWAWTALAAIAGGLSSKRRGWLVGLAGVGLGWALLVGYNFVVAPAATAELARVVGVLFGNLPPAVTVAGSVLIGAAIGALGGLTGQLIAASVNPKHAVAG